MKPKPSCLLAQSDRRRIVPEGCRCVASQRLRTVIITLGSRGSFVATANSKQLVPGFKVKPVDTTAAGDTFNGGLAVAWPKESR